MQVRTDNMMLIAVRERMLGFILTYNYSIYLHALVLEVIQSAETIIRKHTFFLHVLPCSLSRTACT